MPVSALYFNYSGPVFGVLLIIALIDWFARGRYVKSNETYQHFMYWMEPVLNSRTAISKLADLVHSGILGSTMKDPREKRLSSQMLFKNLATM